MREITIENVRGSTLEIVLLGSSADHVAAEPINFESNDSPVLVAISCA
ncbi:hypothetical protein MKX01_014676, partial [Papaver californicum]